MVECPLHGAVMNQNSVRITYVGKTKLPQIKGNVQCLQIHDLIEIKGVIKTIYESSDHKFEVSILYICSFYPSDEVFKRWLNGQQTTWM